MNMVEFNKLNIWKIKNIHRMLLFGKEKKYEGVINQGSRN